MEIYSEMKKRVVIESVRGFLKSFDKFGLNLFFITNSFLSMRFISTLNQSPEVGLEEAIFRGLPPDNGLYMPTEIPVLPLSFWETIEQKSLVDIAFEIAFALLKEDIEADTLRKIIEKAIDFEAPVIPLDDFQGVLELFHGPSMAFKDFGARFMAGLMSYFLAKNDQQIEILVATSGDTGGAVAQGFFRTPHVRVTILYPKGKVSDIQEMQLTTLGENIRALEVDGTFDDCQALVKQAFLDQSLRNKLQLASANSINIARLIPQAFYFAAAYAQAKKNGLPVVFSVPSGNFGNLSAGVLAYKMGMPVLQFLAATNANKVIPDYLKTGDYQPISPSVATISNAMDVGNPSNFPRLKALFGSNFDDLRSKVTGFSYTDAETKEGIRAVYQKYAYLMCPHTAIGYLALEDYRKTQETPFYGIVLSTAHYAKFLPEMEPVLGTKLPIPERLENLLVKQKVATPMPVDFAAFKQYLLESE